MSELNASAIDAIARLEARAQGVRPITLPEGAPPVVVLPEGATHVDLTNFMPSPPWVEEAPQLTTAESFVQYVQRFERPGVSLVFVEQARMDRYEGPKATALINYHAANEAGPATPERTDHQAIYAFKNTVEWARWTKNSGHAMSQREMALFLEENGADIVQPKDDPSAPAPSDIAQIAMNLELRRNVAFRGGVRLESGDHRLEYVEETKAGGSKEKAMQVPNYFWLEIPVFVDGPKYQVKAWFRYQLKSTDDGTKKLSLHYQLHRPHMAVDLAIADTVDMLRDKLQSPVLYGVP